MKRTALILATAAMALTSTLASAQPYGGRNNNDNRYENRDNRGYNGGQRWQRGQRLDQRYRSRDRMISNYGQYRLRAPPRGYGYYRSDNGDILMAAIATGLIASVIAGSANNGYGGGYGQPTYEQPGYGYGYAPAPQVFHDQYGRAYTIDQYGRSVWIN